MIALALRYWWAIVIAGLLVALGAEHLRANRHKTAFAEYRAELALNLALASEDARREEQRRQAETEEERQHAIDEKQALEGTVLLAADAADRLRLELDAFKRRTAGTACATVRSPGKPDTSAIDMLAELYSRADGEAEILARYADELRIAGGACERTADKVKAGG